MKYASAMPYTEAEREADREANARVRETIHNRRKSLKTGQNYDVPGNKASKSRDQRILGER
jgi:hypothetical protein